MALFDPANKKMFTYEAIFIDTDGNRRTEYLQAFGRADALRRFERSYQYNRLVILRAINTSEWRVA